MKPSPLFLGNWKMHLLPHEAQSFMREFLSKYSRANNQSDCGFAPAYLSIPALQQVLPPESGILVGAQNVHWTETGAHTGEVSPKMLASAGVDFAIIGHSERRALYGENDSHVALRTKAALENGLMGVVCVGETQEQYQSGSTIEIVKGQLSAILAVLSGEVTSRLIIAYEPVWAIGTGLAATPEHARNVHTLIRSELNQKFGTSAGEQIRILYGGSTKPDNIAELIAQPNVNGALVGGASLKPDMFYDLISAGRTAYGNA